MSYEGYSQFWCKKGHYWIEDCYSADLNKPCPTCKEKVVYERMVDTTNDEGHPIRPILDKKKTKVCKCCKSILEAVYKIPKQKATHAQP